MPYTLHPSEKLVSVFKEKPWQGCNPATTQFLFVGLDANYAADIEESLPEVFDYLHSGVDFWRTKGVHHPFMLPRYHGSGKKYHEKFAEIGFTAKHAELVSFIELLHLPTVGRRSLNVGDLSMEHLNLLSSIFESGSAKHVFVSSKVTELMRQTNLFPWLQEKSLRIDGDLAVLRDQKGQIIYKMYHFLCYGWQLEVLNRQIIQIRKIVESTV